MNIKLLEWGKRQFDPPPAKRTLHGWAKAGRIYPPPVKVGRAWYCDERARYVEQARSAETANIDPIAAEIWRGI